MKKVFTEQWAPDIDFSVHYEKHLHSEKTPFQQLDFYQSKTLGRFFTLDGILMTTEKDEHVYHEMVVHTPLSINHGIKHVLVIGGGDGGTVRELTRYASIQTIEMVEIDERVVRACQAYFPQTTSGLLDARVKLVFADGLAYVKNSQKQYDLIIVDSTDPIGPGEGLFSQAFYENCYRILTEEGILINQHESPYFAKEATEMKRAHQKIKRLFPIAKVYQAFIPTYPSGHWLFGFASKKYDPISDFKEAYSEKIGLQTRYYNAQLHKGSFALPNDVKKELSQV